MFIPTARYMLALKLKSLRISDFDKGAQDMSDTAHLLKVLSRVQDGASPRLVTASSQIGDFSL